MGRDVILVRMVAVLVGAFAAASLLRGHFGASAVDLVILIGVLRLVGTTERIARGGTSGAVPIALAIGFIDIWRGVWHGPVRHDGSQTFGSDVAVGGLLLILCLVGVLVGRRMRHPSRRLPEAVWAKVVDIPTVRPRSAVRRVAVQLEDGQWFRPVDVIYGTYVSVRGGRPPFDPAAVVNVVAEPVEIQRKRRT